MDNKELSCKDIPSDISQDDNHGETRTGSSFGAYFNIICAVAGTGTLGLPAALKDGGWITLAFILSSCVLSIYTSRLLVECLYYQPNKRLKEFPDIGEAAFGTPGRIFVKIFHYSISLFSGVLYVMLTGTFAHYFVRETYNYEPMGLKIWILLAGILASIPTVFFKTLKEIILLSAFGATATLIMVLCVAIESFKLISEPSFTWPEYSAVNWKDLPFAMGTVAFGFSGNVVYPHIEGGMRHPKSWNKVLFLALSSATTMYFIIAIIGYLAYGNKVDSPILVSLPFTVATKLAIVVISLHVLLATPIYLCSFCLEQEALLKIDRHYISASGEFIYRVALRSSVCAFVTLTAMYVPFFSDVMSLIGSVSNCIMIFLVPIACHYKLFGFRNRHPLEYILGILAILTAIIGLCLGSYSAIKNLVGDFNGTRNVEFLKRRV